MPSAEDLTGRQFGALMAVRRTDDGCSRVTFLCRCVCGKEVEKQADNLRNGTTKSCGCLKSAKARASYEDVSGSQIGQWTLIRRVVRHGKKGLGWECRCSCGAIGVHMISSLRSGLTQSCGCVKKRKVDIAGQRFGRLTAVRPCGKNSRGTRNWLCLCDCERTKVIDGGDLRRGATISCGCAKADENTPLRALTVRAAASARQHTRRARVRGAAGSFTASQIAALYVKQQGLCAEPTCKHELCGSYHKDHFVPLAKGGSNDIKNIQLLCRPCNQGKHAKDPIVWAQERGRLL